jgi:membrane-bound serine protease (ClpP class)
MNRLFTALISWLCFSSTFCIGIEVESIRPIYVIPIRDDVADPLAYLVRRGVKEAMEANAQVIILDMDTHGGRLDSTEEIIEILGKFKGSTVTYVNRKAFSAGAFIAVATQKIYMAEGGVIGAAAPIMLSPGGGSIEKLPETFEVKMTSGVRALVRASAEKNGYNVDVIEAMIDKNKDLVIDGVTLNEKGQILTLTNREAERNYGSPPKPLLSSGTMADLSALVRELGLENATLIRVDPLGAEKFASLINTISPLLLIIGMIGIYLEFKTPGFGLPGIVGIVAFSLYFLGGYAAGLAGLEWAVVFFLGLVLIAAELFIFTGTVIPGLLGAAFVLIALLMATVDWYPGMPAVPSLPQLKLPIRDLLISLGGSAVVVWLLSLVLPKTPIYGILVSRGASGEASVQLQQAKQERQIGLIGVAVSDLRPGGKAQFGEEIVDVITQGDIIRKGKKVRILGHSSVQAVVGDAGDAQTSG